MSITRYFYRSKWASMAASVWIQCSSGSSYCFGIYSPLLKSSQSYDQSTLNSIAFFKDAGANIGVLSGFLYSSFSSGRCPMAVLIAAAHSQTFFNTADVVSAVENFPDSRGTVVGIMKGFLGLSGALLIQIYRTFFNGSPSTFLLMLAILPTVLPLLLMFFVRVQHTNGEDVRRHLNAFSFIAMAVALYLMIIIIGENFIAFPKPVRIAIFSLLLFLLLSPLSIVFKAHLREPISRSEYSSHDKIRLIEKANLSENEELKNGGGQSMDLFQALRTWEFWLLFMIMICAMGSGLATVNNMSQIGSSLGYTGMETSTLVSLWSIWNFAGRFGGGYISDYFLYKKGCARPFFIALTLALMSIGHATISSGIPGSLYVGSVLIGVCYGSQWSLMPTITSELFGIRYFGTIFNTVAIAAPVGSYFLSVRVVGYIYDIETSSGMENCRGTHCFMLSFLIMALIAALGFTVSMALYFKTRRFYKQFVSAPSLS